ncbi:hypothetical protein [Pantoea sp. ME81]|uniref:hypothetical protein n=1 Tax=Pantoea sp. ME81 TaxID=2743935 RepID=UPI0015F4617B|nr:hypothetical protein [Pantoea sp. ME81]
MKSKAYHAFEQKISYFDDDVDLIDVLRDGILKGELNDPDSKYLIKNIDGSKHKHLSRRSNSDGSRELVINHLRTTLYSGYIKDVYEEVTHYLRMILIKSAENGFDSARIVGEHTCKLDAAKILSSGSWQGVSELVANSIFQSLESEQSTLKLIKKISDKLALNVDSTLINNALPYLEIRHFLIHADGRLTQDFINKNKKIKHKDRYVKLELELIKKLRLSVSALIKEFDSKVVSCNLLKEEDLQP